MVTLNKLPSAPPAAHTHDHGTDLTGLTDDDHTQYLKEEASGGLASEVPDHTHASGAEAGTVSHADLTGVTASQHHAAVTASGAHTMSAQDIQAVAATTALSAHVELATTAETTTGTDTGRVPPVSALPLQIQDSKWTYAADAQASDAYAITLAPAPTAYAAGQVFWFKANTANTGAATLNVNSLGATTIKKNHDQDLADNDIEVGSVVGVVYDGTNFQMFSHLGNASAGGSNPVAWLELPHNAQGSSVVTIPAFATVSYAKLGVFMPTTPSAQHSFSFFKTGSGTPTGAVTVTTSGNFWTTTVSYSMTALTDYMAVRHDTNAQDADETSTSPHPDEGLKIYVALIP